MAEHVLSELCVLFLGLASISLSAADQYCTVCTMTALRV